MTALRKYGVEATFNFDLFEVDGIDFRVDAAHASGDTKVMKDEGAEANTDNAFVDEGQGYSITLTATEMEFARGKIYIVDSATKAWLDTSITIETYGNASAQHAFDLDAALTAVAISDVVHEEALEDHVTEGTSGYAQMLAVYAGSDGPGIYLDSGAANTNTVKGTDGTESHPVSTFAAARTLADGIGLKIYYLEGNSDITLAATHVDWEFIGVGSVGDNIVNLGTQDVSRSLFRNLTLEGTQGGSGRMTARDCLLQDPGAGTTTFHIFAERCGLVDDILVDTSADNIFDSCYDAAPSGAAPIITATGASGSIIISHYGGKLELKSLSASHNIRLDGIGDIEFNADCNVNASLDIHGIWDVTDNTAGMSDLAALAALINMTKINSEADIALADAGCTESRLAELDAGNLPTEVADVKSDTAALLSDTGEIGTAGAGLTDLGGMSDGMKDEINVEVDLALDTVIPELGVAIPAATPTLRTAAMLPYMALRNKLITQTSGTDALEVHNDAGTKITKKLLSDDGADYTEAKMS